MVVDFETPRLGSAQAGPLPTPTQYARPVQTFTSRGVTALPPSPRDEGTAALEGRGVEPRLHAAGPHLFLGRNKGC